MGRKRKKTPLPVEGSILAFPLPDGRFGACRVIRARTTDEARTYGTGILVACSAWIGNHLPDAHDPALGPILHLTHHRWNNIPHVVWISELPPDNFTLLGIVESDTDEKYKTSDSFGYWQLMLQVLDQWRWDHDRESVLAEDEQDETQARQKQQLAQKEAEAYLVSLTLDKLPDYKFFSQWDDYPSKKAIGASRKIMENTVQQLVHLGTASSESERLSVLRECIIRFNSINSEMNFIDTDVREDICTEFDAIVHACGFGSHKNLADEWRDW